MPTLNVDTINDSAGTGAPNFPNGLTVGGLDPAPTSQVRVGTGNGHGSTNTKIRRFTTTISTAGSDITYADSAANGGSFTINQDGVYAISYTDLADLGSLIWGISINSTQLTTTIQNITAANRLAHATLESSPGFDAAKTVTAIVRCSSGDVLRAHTSGEAQFLDSDAQTQVTVTQLYRY